MNRRLAIKGHPTRGSEVIKILEMLGGINHGFYKGDGQSCLYYIDNKDIKGSDYLEFDEFIVFTLEEFLEKYPFKVCDKVICKNLLALDSIYVVKKIIWDNNQIKYIIHNTYCDKYNFTVFIVTAEDLQPYTEEIYMDNTTNNTKPGITIDGEKLIAPKGYTIKTATMNGSNLTVEYVKNKSRYPKTYKECCKLLSLGEDGNLYTKGYKARLIQGLQKLLICRDAYWKIAGEEMGLEKPWEPNWTAMEGMSSIFRFRYNIVCCSNKHQQCLLAFPTKEMRNTFFENFKDLIEECKEFL